MCRYVGGAPHRSGSDGNQPCPDLGVRCQQSHHVVDVIEEGYAEIDGGTGLSTANDLAGLGENVFGGNCLKAPPIPRASMRASRSNESPMARQASHAMHRHPQRRAHTYTLLPR
jgi:hypothetical protein